MLLRNKVPSAAFKLTGMEEEGRQQANFITVLTCMSQLSLLFQHLYLRDAINTLFNNVIGTQQCNTCGTAAEPRSSVEVLGCWYLLDQTMKKSRFSLQLLLLFTVTSPQLTANRKNTATSRRAAHK